MLNIDLIESFMYLTFIFMDFTESTNDNINDFRKYKISILVIFYRDYASFSVEIKRDFGASNENNPTQVHKNRYRDICFFPTHSNFFSEFLRKQINYECNKIVFFN